MASPAPDPDHGGASDLSNNISVLGVGRLGLAFALVIESLARMKVVGVDVSESYVRALNDRTFTTHEPQVSLLLRNASNFSAVTSPHELPRALDHSNLIWILVDTPTGVGRQCYDHSKLSRVLEQINSFRVKNKHIVIGCTVLPGYITNVGRYLLQDCENVTLSYNPEFIAQGQIVDGLTHPDIVLIGEGSKDAGDAIEAVYRRFVPNVKYCRMSAESAEITKLAVNCMVTTKISFANMVGDVADRTPGADKYQILEAIGGDSRIGSQYLKPGYGFGGPCFPRDNRAFGHYMESKGIKPLIPQATDEYNIQHAYYMAEQFIQQNLDLYVFEDVAYKDKSPVPIIEESQKLAVAELLVRAGKRVLIRDRAMIISEVRRVFGRMFEYETVENLA